MSSEDKSLTALICHDQSVIEKAVARILGTNCGFSLAIITLTPGVSPTLATDEIIAAVRGRGSDLQLIIVSGRVEIQRVKEARDQNAPSAKICVITSNGSADNTNRLTGLGADVIIEANDVARPKELAARFREIAGID